jgi:hypothetical protein
MEGIEKPDTDRCREIMNGWDCDGSFTVTSFPDLDLENFRRLIS